MSSVNLLLVPGMYILLSPTEELPEGTDVHIRQHSHQKHLNLCLPLYYYAQVINELGKTQLRNSTVLQCL